MLHTLEDPPKPATIFDVRDVEFDPAIVSDILNQRGFVVLRNFFSDTDVAEVTERANEFFKRPAIAGVMGYWKYDHPKKVLNPFILGGAVVHMMLDERIIEIIEKYMQSECILAEASLKLDRGVGYEYFPIHTDFSPGWKKSPQLGEGLTGEALRDPVGVGAAIYLHDTSEGAFSYCDGTHTFLATNGPNLTDYDTETQKRITERRVRCDGEKGDIVIFDDRGFHGPDQPSQSDRVVILLDYYRVDTFGRIQVSPMPVWTSDLGGLTKQQMRVLGVGATYMIDPQDFSKTRFKYNALYPLVSKLIEYAYLHTHLMRVVKTRFRRYRSNSFNRNGCNRKNRND